MTVILPQERSAAHSFFDHAHAVAELLDGTACGRVLGEVAFGDLVDDVVLALLLAPPTFYGMAEAVAAEIGCAPAGDALDDFAFGDLVDDLVINYARRTLCPGV
ncbi:MAG: hypothetical protein PGN15_09775 [Aeromicrobium erythreum]